MTKHRTISDGERSKNINTLRVTSKLWPGIKTYSGITEDTVLCPGRTHLPETKRSRVNKSHQLGLVPTQEANYFRGDTSDNEQLYQMHPSSESSPQSHEEKLIALELQQSPDAVTMELPQKAVTRPNTVPLVSWNEVSTDRSEHSEYSIHRGLKVTSYTMFNHNCQPAPRPYIAGTRVIVPPKHSCAAGLTSDDLVQGKKLLTEDSKIPTHLKVVDGEHSGTDSPRETKEKEEFVQGAYSKTSKFDAKGSVPKSSIRHLKSANPYNRLRCESGFSKDGTFKPLSSLSPERYIRLELTIMSIDTHRASENLEHLQEPSAQNTTSVTENSEISPAFYFKSSDVKSANHNRRHFRRAQSAPPISRHPLSFTHSSTRPSEVRVQPDLKIATDEIKKFSNVYWRARSSYHRRNLEVNKDPRTDASVAETSPQLKGSLLRPLMYSHEGALMKHSAGCPYRCKQCFKACLVSEDYVADSKTGFSDPMKVARRKTDVSMTQRPKADPLAVVRRALGRSQPLFKQVYGETVEDTIHPWPTYAWVDIKQNIQKSI